ncbi:MAG: hypothetical protein KC731_36265, partial [Myxococcales bacterium]|nr:hypothetical protein [Myxococcales bacterium]
MRSVVAASCLALVVCACSFDWNRLDPRVNAGTGGASDGGGGSAAQGGGTSGSGGSVGMGGGGAGGVG